MNARTLSFVIILFCFANYSFTQDKKTLYISRTEQAPKIDGNLDDAIWQTAGVATDFISFRPEIGKKSPYNERTEVKMAYDDKAIYIAAYLYDDPSKIMKQLT